MTQQPTEPGFTVVPFAERHVKAAAEIEHAVFSEPWSLNAIRALFVGGGSTAGAGHISAFACEAPDGTLAAYGGIECVLDEGNIVNIATAPAFRRRGCASAIMKGLLEAAESKGCVRVTLEVREHNIPAQSLYRSFGFTPAGIRRHFYSFPDEDAVVMEKFIT